MKEELLKLAKEANKYSYSPYSNYPVSASLLMSDGKYYTGVNIENASFGLTNCAERTAIFKAVSEGYKKGDFKAILIYVPRKETYPYPCGACRQVMIEFMDLDTPIYIANDSEKIEELTLKDLVPYVWDASHMEN